MFTLESIIRLHQADAAGIVFFANYFEIAHDAYEAFMQSIGFGFQHVINKTDFLLLIAHAEAHYRKSLVPGEQVRVQLRTEKIGRTSYVLQYTILDAAGDEVCTVRTVHVAVDKKSGEKIPLPADLRKELATIR
jgi:1,4-dihydroxy-2-naphthoyl-CoA hydrolase